LSQSGLAAEQTLLPQFGPSTMSLAVENTKLAIMHRNANNKKTFATFAPSAEMSRDGASYTSLIGLPIEPLLHFLSRFEMRVSPFWDWDQRAIPRIAASSGFMDVDRERSESA
jgi:hypothetical protein